MSPAGTWETFKSKIQILHIVYNKKIENAEKKKILHTFGKSVKLFENSLQTLKMEIYDPTILSLCIYWNDIRIFHTGIFALHSSIIHSST